MPTGTTPQTGDFDKNGDSVLGPTRTQHDVWRDMRQEALEYVNMYDLFLEL